MWTDISSGMNTVNPLKCIDRNFAFEMTTGNKNILLFDGVCNLCNGLVLFIIRRDKKNKFTFASLQSDGGRQQLNRVGLDNFELKSLILIIAGKYYVKSTAVLKLLKELGGIWSIFYLFMIIPRPIRDFVYDLIARSRYKMFGKREVCMIPTPELQSRFL